MIYYLVNTKLFNHILTACVILNTIVLAIDHYGISQDLESALSIFNLIFTITFVIEMALKLLGLGIIEYCQDTMNLFDGVIVILSLFELFIFEDKGASISAFRTVRILRIARLFRHLEYMSKLLEVISLSLSTSIYIALLLFLFTFIFALLGMQIFGNKFEDGASRANFDNFHWAFVTVFQLLTMENWQDILYDAIRSDVGYFSSFFFIC